MKNTKYIFIGDSLTFGYGVNKKDNWVSKLKDTLDCTIINKGVNGNTTTEMLDRFSEDVTSKTPSVVFIMGGTNDLLSNRSVDSIMKNIKLMVADCISIKSKIIIGIPPIIIGNTAKNLFFPSLTYDFCEKNLPLLRNELLKLCSENNIQYLDLYTLTKDNLDKDIFNDGVHLNILGQELIFSKAINVFKSTL